MAKKTEYGKATFLSAVKNRMGMNDDGWGNSTKKAPRMTVANAPEKFSEVVSKRKEMLNEYANGGPVRKGKGYKKKGC